MTYQSLNHYRKPYEGSRDQDNIHGRDGLHLYGGREQEEKERPAEQQPAGSGFLPGISMAGAWRKLPQEEPLIKTTTNKIKRYENLKNI